MSDIIVESENKMKKSMETLKRNFAAVRTGRASPALLDHIKVEYYGTEMPLKQLASISVPEPRMLVISPFDKGAAQAIEKAIMTSDLGINPNRDASVIRLVMPEPSEERRRDLVKLLKKEAEEAKVALRNVRREGMDTLKKQKTEKKITEDVEKGQDKKMQEMTDRYCKTVDDLVKAKEAEVMEV